MCHREATLSKGTLPHRFQVVNLNLAEGGSKGKPCHNAMSERLILHLTLAKKKHKDSSINLKVKESLAASSPGLCCVGHTILVASEPFRCFVANPGTEILRAPLEKESLTACSWTLLGQRQTKSFDVLSLLQP